MRTRIQQRRSSAVLILTFFVLVCGGAEIKAQTDYSCSREASSRSAQTTQAAKLALANQTQETLTGYWLDFGGKRQKWFDLPIGQALELSTFVGHLWLVTKANGQCLAIYSAPGNFRVGKPQSPVNINRPTQSQNRTSPQPTNDPTSKPPTSSPTSASAEAYFAQAEKYFDAKDYAKAVEAYKKAISLKPSCASANLNLGVSYFHLGRPQEALTALAQAYRHAPKNDPNLYLIHYWIGISYVEILADQARRNIITEEDPLYFATGAFEEAVRLKPDHINSQYYLGYVCLLREDFEDAVEAFNTVIRLQPKHVDAHYDLGRTYARSGKKNEALQIYRKLLTLDKERAQKLYAEISKPK